jgi:ABC-type transporter Mla subunit MlaD
VTIEEFGRIEHITAGLAEERRKDGEESRQLWRDTQRQTGELATHMNDLTRKVADTNDVIARLAEEARAADQQFRERIDSLVSAIGETLRGRNRGTKQG